MITVVLILWRAWVTIITAPVWAPMRAALENANRTEALG